MYVCIATYLLRCGADPSVQTGNIASVGSFYYFVSIRTCYTITGLTRTYLQSIYASKFVANVDT